MLPRSGSCRLIIHGGKTTLKTAPKKLQPVAYFTSLTHAWILSFPVYASMPGIFEKHSIRQSRENCSENCTYFKKKKKKKDHRPVPWAQKRMSRQVLRRNTSSILVCLKEKIICAGCTFITLCGECHKNAITSAGNEALFCPQAVHYCTRSF